MASLDVKTAFHGQKLFPRRVHGHMVAGVAGSSRIARRRSADQNAFGRAGWSGQIHVLKSRGEVEGQGSKKNESLRGMMWGISCFSVTTKRSWCVVNDITDVLLELDAHGADAVVASVGEH